VDDAALDGSLRRWKVAGVVVFLLLALALPLSQAVEAANRSARASSQRADLIALGKEVYSANCAKCHGDQGQGVDSPALNSRQFQEAATEDQIYHLAAVGIPGAVMPGWSNAFGGPLTDEQIRATAAFIMTWGVGAPDVPDWRTHFLGTPPPMPPMSNMPGMSGSPSPSPSPSPT
jgi:mono/diheme cytochrome c family protein